MNERYLECVCRRPLPFRREDPVRLIVSRCVCVKVILTFSPGENEATPLLHPNSLTLRRSLILFLRTAGAVPVTPVGKKSKSRSRYMSS